MNKLFIIIIIVIVAMSFQSCSKESEQLNTPAMSDFYPLQVGKYFIYRLDSTVLAPFGTALLTRSYQAKDTIESTFTDNQGRLSYRIFRYTRDTLGLQQWRFAATYFATPTFTTIEYVDNNMRFLKLHAPIKEGYTWKAHSYIDTKSINSTVPYLDEWEYEYRNLGVAYTVLNKTYDSTLTIFQHDENTPDIPFVPATSIYHQRNIASEVYAKGVGLIYKEFLHWTWDSNPPPANYDDGSYGVKLRLISHN